MLKRGMVSFIRHFFIISFMPSFISCLMSFSPLLQKPVYLLLTPYQKAMHHRRCKAVVFMTPNMTPNPGNKNCCSYSLSLCCRSGHGGCSPPHTSSYPQTPQLISQCSCDDFSRIWLCLLSCGTSLPLSRGASTHLGAFSKI